jgi:vWA-MoxR associated protein C-terminal domain/vWA-MoxR associated protein middle region 0/Effector-associated domain 2
VQQPWPSRHQTIVVVDVAGFNNPNRTPLQRGVVQEALYEVMPRAFAESGVDWATCYTENRGDGMMILVLSGAAASMLADRLPSRLVAGLLRHNALYATGAAMQLRVALHTGLVVHNGNAVVSEAVNFAFRLVEAPEARSALASSAGVLALIASEPFYHDVIAPDPAAEPGSYRLIPVEVKETSTSAWLRLPGHAAAVDREPVMGTGASAVVPKGVRQAVVEVLVEVGLADDASSRMRLIQVTGDRLARPLEVRLEVRQGTVGRDHLVEFVDACAKTQGGMAALARAVWVIWPGSHVCEQVCQLVGEPRVLELLPENALMHVRELLVGITIPQLPTLVSQAGGPGVPPAPSVASAWEAFSHLAEFNAGADGFPPALAFVELVAQQVGGEVGAKLTGWNDEQARRLRLEPQLRPRRAKCAARVPAESRLHLMIVVQHDAIDPNRYLLSYWRQDDPSEWQPAPGETLLVKFDQLERGVDYLVVGAERAWSGHEAAVALEFVLPRALLNLPVHRWCKEHDSGDPRPLCLDYPVVVRPLERMLRSQWHRVWRLRWKMLMNDPSAARVHFGQPADMAQPHLIDVALSDPQLALMVLTSAPPAQPRPGVDELGAALRSGLPALVWHPDASSEALREVVTRHFEGDGLGDLPGRVQALRRAGLQASEVSPDVNIAHDLVVLWDDPHRVVNLDQPPDIPRQRRGVIADERERAF